MCKYDYYRLLNLCTSVATIACKFLPNFEPESGDVDGQSDVIDNYDDDYAPGVKTRTLCKEKKTEYL